MTDAWLGLFFNKRPDKEPKRKTDSERKAQGLSEASFCLYLCEGEQLFTVTVVLVGVQRRTEKQN